MITVIPTYDEQGQITNLEQVCQDFINIAKKHGVNINLTNPVTIQDKLSYIELHDRSQLRTDCTDKYLVRNYCKKKLKKDICVPLIGVFDSVDEINFNKLPDRFVIKCNHGYNMNMVVRDKSKLDVQECKSKLSEWMSKDFSINPLIHALHYHFIKPRIIVEELLEDNNQKVSLYDYKFWCFNGEPKMYTINTGNGHGSIMYYAMNDDELDLYDKKKSIKERFIKPNNFDLMVDYARKLSKDFQFVRVDFYEVNNTVYLGELTFTPGACIFKYAKLEYNILVGGMLNLKK